MSQFYEICKGYIFSGVRKIAPGQGQSFVWRGGGNFPRTIFLYEIVEIVQEDLLARKVYYRIYYRISFFTLTHVPSDEQIPYYRKHVSPSFSKIGNLQVFALYLAKFLSLEYAQYKSPPNECPQGINYAIN